MEVGRSDAEIARDRCYEAIQSATDVAEGQALWRAFGRYHWKDRHREDVARLEIQNHALPGRTLSQGGVGGSLGCVKDR